MPSGHVHNLINTGAFLLIAGSAAVAKQQGYITPSLPEILAFTGTFFAGTFMMSPDLDLAEQNVSSKKAWGIFGFIWVPYGKMFSHRGLSHTWIVGPLTRLVYLTIILAALYYLAILILPDLKNKIHFENVPRTLEFWQPYILGYYVSQWLHLIADGISPDMRAISRTFKKKKR